MGALTAITRDNRHQTVRAPEIYRNGALSHAPSYKHRRQI